MFLKRRKREIDILKKYMYHCLFSSENKKSVSTLHQKVLAKKAALPKNKKERPNNKRKDAGLQPQPSLSAKQRGDKEEEEDCDQLNSSQTSTTRYDKKLIFL